MTYQIPNALSGVLSASIVSWLLWGAMVSVLPAVVVWQLVTGKALAGSWRGPQVTFRRDKEPGRYWLHVIGQAVMVLAWVIVVTYFKLRNPDHPIP